MHKNKKHPLQEIYIFKSNKLRQTNNMFEIIRCWFDSISNSLNPKL